MAIEQVLYAQVVILCREDLKFVATDKNKNEAKFKFQNDAPILKYCQKSLNSCCFSSLASSFAIINHNKAANDISLLIKESLESEVGNRIYFSNGILKRRKKIKVNLKCRRALIKF